MKRLFSIVLCILLCGCIFIGCSSGEADQNSVGSSSYEMERTQIDESAPAVPEDSKAAPATEERFGSKIIYYSTLRIETTKFDDSYTALSEAIKKNGGYIAQSNQSGGYNGVGEYSMRYAYFELKIPAEQFDAFLEQSASFGNVVSRQDSSQDITSSYIDIEARIAALKVQEQRLLELLQQANDIESVLTIEAQLAEVRYQIESYTAQLNQFDMLVDYSTISIELVEVTTFISPNTKTFGQELRDAFVGSWQVAVSFLRGLAIVLIYLLPFLIFVGVILLILLPIFKRNRAKRAARLADQRAAYEQQRAVFEQQRAAAAQQAPAVSAETAGENPYVKQPKKK